MKTVIVVVESNGNTLVFSTVGTFCKNFGHYKPQTIRNYMHRHKSNVFKDDLIYLQKLEVNR